MKAFTSDTTKTKSGVKSLDLGDLDRNAADGREHDPGAPFFPNLGLHL